MNNLRFSYLAECIILIGSGGVFVTIGIRDQYIYQAVSESHNFTANKSTTYCSTNESIASEKEKVVADEVSKWQMYCTLSTGLPAVISSTILLSWSDKIGRKVAYFVPLSGYAIYSTMMVFIIKFSLPPFMVVIASSISGLTGSFIALLNACITYLSDIAQSNDEKLRRFTLAECSMGFGGGIMSFATGFWINEAGFFPSICLAAVCSWVAMCLVPFMPTPRTPKNRRSSASNSFTATNGFNEDDISNSNHASSRHQLMDDDIAKHDTSSFFSRFMLIWQVYTSESNTCVICESAGCGAGTTQCSHAGFRRVWRAWFYLIAFNMYLYPVLGLGTIDVLYFVAYPLCFTPLYLGIKFTLKCICVVLTPFLVVFFKSVVHWRNGSIIILGIFITIGIYTATAFVRQPYVIFVVTAFNLFSQATSPVIRTQISSLFSPSEQGAAFGLVSGTENLTNLLGNVTYLILFPATLHVFRGFLFLLSAGFLLVPLFLMTCVWIADNKKKSPENEEDDVSPLIAS